jgi:hypothetical protein
MQDSDRPAPDTTTGAKAPEPETDGDCPLTKPVEQTFRFHSLPKWEQQQIIHMHKNLGHPSMTGYPKLFRLPDIDQMSPKLPWN